MEDLAAYNAELEEAIAALQDIIREQEDKIQELRDCLSGYQDRALKKKYQ